MSPRAVPGVFPAHMVVNCSSAEEGINRGVKRKWTREDGWDIALSEILRTTLPHRLPWALGDDVVTRE